MKFPTQNAKSFQLFGRLMFVLPDIMTNHHPKHQPSLLTRLLPILLFTSLCLSESENHHPHLPLPNHILTQFPNPTWLENIAVRSNGDLLLTEFAPTASLHLVSNPNPNPNHHPFSSNDTTIRRETIHRFDSVQALSGIAEPVEDLFVVVGGNVSAAGLGPGNAGGSPFFAWTVDFRCTHTTHDDSDGDGVGTKNETKPEINQIAHLTSALLPNGMASIPGNPNAVLIADSFAGLVWRLDIRSGVHEVAVQVPEMTAPVNASGVHMVGVNGIKMHRGHLYWTNSATIKIYRIKLDQNGYHEGNGTAAVETIADLSSQATFLDDFAIGNDGVIWVATNSGNTLFAVKEGKKAVLVGGGETELTFAGDTAAAFGRGDERDRKTLYVTTCGGLKRPINGTVTDGGKVVAVDTSGFWL